MGPSAAKRLAGFVLPAPLAFAATQWPHASSWAAPVATAADSAVLKAKCVPLSIQSAGLSATAAGCSAVAGSGTRPQSGYPVEPHPSAPADVGSDCQLDCERIQTKESRCFNERLPDNNHAPEAVKEGCFKEQTSYTNHAPEDVVQFDKNFSAARSTTENILTSKPSGEAEAAASSRPDCCDAKAIEGRGYHSNSSSTPTFLVLNSDIDAATRFLHDLDRGLEVPWLHPMVLAAAALAAVRPPGKA